MRCGREANSEEIRILASLKTVGKLGELIFIAISCNIKIDI